MSYINTPDANQNFDEAFRNEESSFVKHTLDACAVDEGTISGGEKLTELDLLLEKLKLGKAPGHDEVQYEHLRYCGSNLREAIARLFNAVVRIGHIPYTWNHGC